MGLQASTLYMSAVPNMAPNTGATNVCYNYLAQECNSGIDNNWTSRYTSQVE